MSEKKLFMLIYEPGQISEAIEYVKTHPGARIICLDFWIERELKASSVPYMSMSLSETTDSEDSEEVWWELVQKVAREWYRIPAMQFFEYKGIRIAEALEPIMEAYLSRLFCYARIYSALKKSYPNTLFFIPAPAVDDRPTAGVLITFERLAVIDAAEFVRLEHVTLGARATSPRRHLFPRTLRKSFLVHMYNAIIGLTPRRRRKIYASEYWSHIGPIITKMEDTELVLMEASELKHIPWRQILEHRIRIKHPADATGKREQREAIQVAQGFMEKWRTAREGVAAYLSRLRGEFDWNPVLTACEYLVMYAPRVVADIDALGRIIKKEQPDTIVQLASVGGRRHHFFLLARIAAALKIPSIELQHAGAVFDPRSVHSRLEASYLAAYGEIEREQYARNGYAQERIIVIGSPRFDHYRQSTEHLAGKRAETLASMKLDATRRVVMITVPEERISLYALDFSSHTLAAFFRDFQEVRRIMPDVQFIFKFRRKNCTEHHRAYLQELFSEDGIAITDGNPYPLICASDCVLSGNSTIMYETMISDRPLILYPWKKWDYHLALYSTVAPHARSGVELADILQKLFTNSSYRRDVLANERRFMERHAFDGHSTERFVTLLNNPPVHI